MSRARLTAARVLGLSLIPLLAASGCGAEPQNGSWSLRVANEDVRERAAAVDAMILEGGCDGQRVLYRAEVRTNAPGPKPPVLAPGDYGFAGRARDAACRTIARGCVDVTLPAKDEHFEILLEPVSEAPACEPDACRAGRCDGEGPADAGVAPPDDSGSPFVDAGLPPDDAGAPPDDDAGSGPRDAGPAWDGGGDDDDGGARPPDAGGEDAGAADAGPDPVDAGHDAGPPPGCVERGDSCYVLRTVAEDWPTAQVDCITWGGSLVTLDDMAEESWIVTEFGSSLEVWIGINDRDEEGTWTWASGSDASYRHWAPGQPDDKPPGEDCGVYDASVNGWQDRFCKQTRAYVCERPLD